jgi:DNA polymerase I-like protein with 3'-5' exonuclease and polymerase domains
VNQVHDEIVMEIPLKNTVDYQEMASKIRQTIFDATQGFLSRVEFLSGGGLCLETGTWADK